MRTVQKLVDDEWKPVKFWSLKENDYFRLFDNIAPVSDQGKYIFHATSKPYFNEHGDMIINYEMC